MTLITIKSFSDQYEANLCKGLLKNQGIECFLANETHIQSNPLLKGALGGYQLQCREEDAKKALEILEEK